MARVSHSSVKPKTRGGVVTKTALRWSLNLASQESGVHREQLERRRRQLGIDPREDGLYSTRDVLAMLFGDKEAELIGKLAAERKKVELDNARTEGEVIPTASALKIAGSFLVPARQKILSSSMPDAEKDDVLSDLVRLGDVDWKKEARSVARAR